jgi:hypothetical protein
MNGDGEFRFGYPVMVGVSYLIRKNMDESPVFAKAKSEGKQVQTLKESFGNRYNMKFVLLALFATMGQGVVWYTVSFTQ